MPTANQYLNFLQTVPAARAFLDTIAWAEGGRYNNVFGGGTFTGNQHPNRRVTAGGYTSTAAGRYQFLYSTWIGIKNKLGLSDFSPTNQDIAALELISQRGQLNNLLNNKPEAVMRGLGCAWAALPFSGCGQPQRGLAETLSYYNRALQALGGGNGVINTSQVTPSNTATANTLPVANNIPVASASTGSRDIFIVGGIGLVALLIIGNR